MSYWIHFSVIFAETYIANGKPIREDITVAGLEPFAKTIIANTQPMIGVIAINAALLGDFPLHAFLILFLSNPVLW